MVVQLSPYDPNWAGAFRAEAAALRSGLGQGGFQHLHHIGSTAIPGLYAKPIIDLLGEVANLCALDEQSEDMRALGYEVMGAHGIEGRRYYRKFNAEGQRTHHLHVFQTGSAHSLRHLAFRDYLIAHPQVASDYAQLKRDLIADHFLSREGYQEGKAPFITATEAKALAWSTKSR